MTKVRQVRRGRTEPVIPEPSLTLSSAASSSPPFLWPPSYSMTVRFRPGGSASRPCPFRSLAAMTLRGKVTPGRSKIDSSDPAELKYWTRHLGVIPEELQGASNGLAIPPARLARKSRKRRRQGCSGVDLRNGPDAGDGPEPT